MDIIATHPGESRYLNAYYQNTAFPRPKNARPKVSVIIPTLNEAKNLPLVLPYLPMSFIDEVLLVDGRSTDNTVEVAQQLLPSIKVILEKRKGKGIAMRAGYAAATGDILIVLDADGSNDPREIPRYIRALMEGSDFVKGSRFATGGGTTDMPTIRKWGNGGLVTVANLLFGVKFTDLCYGMHAFWRYCLDSLDLENMDGFEIDTALYLQAVRARLHIVEVPSFEGFRFYGVGKLQTIPDGIRVLRTILAEWRIFLRNKNEKLHLGFRGENYALEDMVLAPQSALAAHAIQLPIQQLAAGNVDKADMCELLGQVLNSTLQALDASGGSIFLLDDHGNVRDDYLMFDSSGNQVGYSVAWSDVLKEGLAGWVIKNRQPALVSDTREDPRWLKRSWEHDHGDSRAALALPVVDELDKVVGVMTLTRPQEKSFSIDELKRLPTFSLQGV